MRGLLRSLPAVLADWWHLATCGDPHCTDGLGTWDPVLRQHVPHRVHAYHLAGSLITRA